MARVQSRYQGERVAIRAHRKTRHPVRRLRIRIVAHAVAHILFQRVGTHIRDHAHNFSPRVVWTGSCQRKCCPIGFWPGQYFFASFSSITTTGCVFEWSSVLIQRPASKVICIVLSNPPLQNSTGCAAPDRSAPLPAPRY